MCFPFLCVAAKNGLFGLKQAESQNANCAVTALTTPVHLFRITGLQSLWWHRRLLFFSVEHDRQQSHVHGFYPVISGETTSYHRKSALRRFFFDNGAQRWQAYTFVSNRYKEWAPTMYSILNRAVEALPEPERKRD